MQVDYGIARFMIAKKANGLARRTQFEYWRVLTFLLRWCANHNRVYLEDLDRDAICEYVAALRDQGWADATVAYYIRPLRAWLHWLYKENYTPTNLAQTVQSPRSTTRVEDVPTLEEIDKLLAVSARTTLLDLRDRALIFVMWDTGIRLGEIVLLKVEDWVYEAGAEISYLLIYSPKTYKPRLNPCAKMATEALKMYLEARKPDNKNEPLFVGLDGHSVLDSPGIDRMLRRRAEKAGLDPRKIHPHVWRKAFATYAAENGMDPTVLLKLGGWSSLDMLEVYICNSRKRIIEMHTRTSPVDNGLKCMAARKKKEEVCG